MNAVLFSFLLHLLTLNDLTFASSAIPILFVSSITPSLFGKLLNVVSAACVPGTRIGAIIVLQPNQSTVGVVGSYLNISWTYNNFVTKRPNNISLELSAAIMPKLWSPMKAPDLEPNQTQWQWLIPPQQDGQFVLRLLSNGQDPEKGCFEDGEAKGGMSPIFRIASPRPLLAYPDRYGPISSTHSMKYSMHPIWRWLLILSSTWWLLPRCGFMPAKWLQVRAHCHT